MAQSILIKAKCILRKSRNSCIPTAQNEREKYRFCMRWTLEEYDDRKLKITFPRVYSDNGNVLTDEFTIKIKRNSPNQVGEIEYFDFARNDFGIAESSIKAKPMLDAVIQPRLQRRLIHPNDLDYYAWVTTDNMEPDSEETIQNNQRGALRIFDILFDHSKAAGLWQCFLFLKERVSDSISEVERKFSIVPPKHIINIGKKFEIKRADAYALSMVLEYIDKLNDPAYLPSVIIEQQEKLEKDFLSRKLDIDINEFKANIQFLAIFSHVLSPRLGENPEFVINRLRNEISDRKSATEMLAFSGFHGGTILAYNTDTLLRDTTQSEFHQDRLIAKDFLDSGYSEFPYGQYPGAEMLGLGLTSGEIDKSTIIRWLEEGEEIEIEVTGIEPEKHDINWESKICIEGLAAKSSAIKKRGRIYTKNSKRNFKSHPATRLTLENLKLAIQNGSSFPCLPPQSAEVLWDLVQNNSQHKETDWQPTPVDNVTNTIHTQGKVPIPTYPTGDMRCQFLVSPPSDMRNSKIPEKDRHWYGINVYALWENNETAPIFNESEHFSSQKYQRYLFNRRYTYLTDIWTTYKENKASKISPCHDSVLNFPPIQPYVFKGTNYDNHLNTIFLSGEDKELLDIYKQSRRLKNKFICNLDLRLGSLMPYQNKWAGYSGDARYNRVTWEPNGLIDSSFRADTLHHFRDKSRKYKFYVTAVDCFEQESIPVPVINQEYSIDEQVIPQLLYQPKFRSQILPAPALFGTKTSGRKIEIKWDKNREFDLIVSWETPFENETSQLSDTVQTNRMNKHYITANLLLYKRLIENLSEISKKDAEIENIHSLSTLNNYIESKGWKLIDNSQVQSPTSNDKWEWSKHFESNDAGFQYIAAIYFEVNNTGRDFYRKTTSDTRYHRFDEKNDAIEVTIDEIITESIVTLTETYIEALQSNKPYLTRSPQDGKLSDFSKVTPLRSIPTVNRDLVLTALLNRDFSHDNNQNTVPLPLVIWPNKAEPKWAKWGGQQYLLTIGQIAVIESTIARLDIKETRIDLKENKWVPFIEMLAAEQGDLFVPGDEKANVRTPSNDSYSQLIGFRGAQELSWSYNSNEIASEELPTLEATMFHLYQSRTKVRTSKDDVQSINSITSMVKFDLANLNISIEIPELLKYENTSFLKNKTPRYLTAQITSVPGLFIFCHSPKKIKNTLVYKTSKNSSLIAAINESNSEMLECEISEAFEIKQILANSLFKDDSNTYTLNIPIGGGYQEVYSWWVIATNCIEVLSEAVFIGSKQFPTTVTPPSPTKVNVRPLIGDEQLTLDFKNHKQFYPKIWHSRPDSEIKSLLKTYPRLILSWETDVPDTVTDIGVIIWKQRERLNQQGVELAYSDSELLEALIFVQNISKEFNIPKNKFDIIDNYWLRSFGQLNSQSNTSSPFWKPRELREDNGFISIHGLSNLQISGVKKSYFYDYFDQIFEENETNQSAMRYDTRYKYFIASYIDLYPNSKIDENERYLISEVTEWTPYQVPISPAWDIVKTSETLELVEAPNPSVQFIFSRDLSIMATQLSESYYKVIIYRKVNNSLLANSESSWVIIGEPILVSNISFYSISITDIQLDREHIDALITAEYQVAITEVVKISDKQELTLRKKESSIIVKIDKNIGENTEHRKVIIFSIK